MKILVLYIKVLRQLGLKVGLFRMWYAFQNKIGLMNLRFSSKETYDSYSLAEFKKSTKFFFDSRKGIELLCSPNESLKRRSDNIQNGNFLFFHSKTFKLGKDYDWITNPESGHKYNTLTHFSKINDFSNTKGDIKYVWEPSRFSWIYDVIRYSHHFQKDNSDFVLCKITSWIDSNPINLGPNYKCSQEISIRVLNWIFALYFYKESNSLSENTFNKILNSIRCQTEHIFKNINFSRIAVQNNHAITETLTLYIVGLLFPEMPNSSKWKKKGKSWFEQEIRKQIFDDGSYWQHSMNYHRLVTQLLTWAIRLAEVNNEKFDNEVYIKSKRTLDFIKDFVNKDTGYLPNYGANDGSLLFPLNNSHFRDYRGQLNALSVVLKQGILFDSDELMEDVFWYGYKKSYIKEINIKTDKALPYIKSFNSKGYHLFKNDDFFFFIRCGNVESRPGINDNLHFDLWYKGQNIFRDTGSYKYNTLDDIRSFFTGGDAHNVLLINNESQIEKGPRFISFGKSMLKDKTEFRISDNKLYFKGTIGGWEKLGENITHIREVFYEIGSKTWEIHDSVKGTDKPIQQVWNYDNDLKDCFDIKSCTFDNTEISIKYEPAYYSSSYGHLLEQKQIVFGTKDHKVKTIITFK